MLDYYPETDFTNVEKVSRTPAKADIDLLGSVISSRQDPSRIPGLSNKPQGVVEETPGVAVDEVNVVTPEQVAYMVDASLKTGIVIGGALTLAAGLVYILIVK